MSASSPEKVEQLAAAMAAEREMAAGKSPTSPALFSTPDFPDAGACRLLEAAVTGSLRKTEEALAAGVPAACADANGHTPLHQCAFMGFEAVAGALLAADAACVHARNLMHNTPLHTAAFQGYAGIVGLLLNAGADVNTNGTAGNTPLHLASLEGNLEVMEVLLGAGADPNATCSNRNTPLHVVATAGIDDPLPVARLLLRHGAAPEAPNRFGKTPLDLAHFQAQRPLARVLQAAAHMQQDASPARVASSPSTPSSASQRPPRFRLQPLPTASGASDGDDAEPVLCAVAPAAALSPPPPST